MPAPQRLFYGFLAVVFFGSLLAYGIDLYVDRVSVKREIAASSAAKQLGIAALEYTQDHGGHYPDAGRWEPELTPYLGPSAAEVLHPPAPLFGTPRRFSMNPALSGKSQAQLDSPSNIWMFYESVSAAPSASDNLDHWPDAGRDGGQQSAVVWGDGHCYSRSLEWKEGVLKHLPGY